VEMERGHFPFLDIDTYRKFDGSYVIMHAINPPAQTSTWKLAPTTTHLTFLTFHPGEHVTKSHSYGWQQQPTYELEVTFRENAYSDWQIQSIFSPHYRVVSPTEEPDSAVFCPYAESTYNRN
jgi:hypothetical protein